MKDKVKKFVKDHQTTIFIYSASVVTAVSIGAILATKMREGLIVETAVHQTHKDTGATRLLITQRNGFQTPLYPSKEA